LTVSIDIPEDIDARLRCEVEASGVALPELLRDLLIEHFEEVEDRLLAQER
jgi:hypothetical protein